MDHQLRFHHQSHLVLLSPPAEPPAPPVPLNAPPPPADAVIVPPGNATELATPLQEGPVPGVVPSIPALHHHQS